MQTTSPTKRVSMSNTVLKYSLLLLVTCTSMTFIGTCNSKLFSDVWFLKLCNVQVLVMALLCFANPLSVSGKG